VTQGFLGLPGFDPKPENIDGCSGLARRDNSVREDRFSLRTGCSITVHKTICNNAGILDCSAEYSCLSIPERTKKRSISSSLSLQVFSSAPEEYCTRENRRLEALRNRADRQVQGHARWRFCPTWKHLKVAHARIEQLRSLALHFFAFDNPRIEKNIPWHLPDCMETK
jgi:hypothetical protein